tara:strand:- start:426 stop:1088 length:663 start_codon:yes stop_codon:yes gene_type:complete
MSIIKILSILFPMVYSDLSVTWTTALGVDNDYIIQATDNVILNWSSGHNVYYKPSVCVTTPSAATGYTEIPSTQVQIYAGHPGGSQVTLPHFPPGNYCIVCTFHLSYMQFTLRVQSAPPVCCQALIASCLACAEEVTVEEYCEGNPDVSGCPGLSPPQPNSSPFPQPLPPSVSHPPPASQPPSPFSSFLISGSHIITHVYNNTIRGSNNIISIFSRHSSN